MKGRCVASINDADLIQDCGNGCSDDLKKPPKPKRVSSVLSSCKKTEANVADHDKDASLNMGSSSSLQQSTSSRKTISSPKFQFKVTDFDSDQHRVLPQDVTKQTHNILLDELNRIKHSSDRKLKKSTFKADLPSAIVLSHSNSSIGYPDNSELKKALLKGSNPAVFHSKEKYEFDTEAYKDDLKKSLNCDDITKPIKVKYDTAKFQQSDAPVPVDITSKAANDSAVTNSFSNPAYSSCRSNSVSDLFHRSKSRVRNSLRNLRFYARNLSNEEKPVDVTTYHQAPSCDLLPLPDDRDIDSFSSTSTDWLNQSFSSDNTDSMLSNKQRSPSNRTALPVNVPTVQQSMASFHTKPITHDISPMTHEPTNVHDSRLTANLKFKKHVDSISANFQTDIRTNSITANDPIRPSSTNPTRPISTNTTRPYTLNLKPDALEHESIALLDKIIEGHSRNLTQTSVVSMQTVRSGISGDMQLTPKEERPVLTATSADIKPIVSRGQSVREVLSHENIAAEIISNKSCSTIKTPSSHRVSSTSFSSNQLDDDSFDSCESFSSGSRQFEDREKQNNFDSQILANNDQIRKTAWLFVKPMLIAKRRKVELATKRNWQKYWVNLKGGHLLFYDLEAKGQGSEDPVITLPVDGAMVQAIPEHAKRENVFCFSTNDGSTFLMQASSHAEVMTLIQSIHMEAASLFARNENISVSESPMTKRFIRSLLLHDIENRKREIEMDEKMKKMADLQAILVSDVKSRRAISEQVLKWVENLEKNHVFMYRNRCFLSSLDGDEPPSSHNALASVCKSSKLLLSSLKLFNISSLYALVVSKQLNSAETVSSTATTPRKKLSSVGVIRSGSFNSKRDIKLKSSISSVSGDMSPSKSKMANIFASLRGFDTWKGPGTKSKRNHQRSSVASVLSTFMTSGNAQSSVKDTNDSKSKNSNGFSSNKTSSSTEKKWTTNRNSNNENLQMFLKMEDYPSPEPMSEDDNIDEVRNSSVGSLDSLLLAPPDEWSVPHGWNSSTVNVSLSTDDMVTITTTENMTFKQLLEVVCQRKQLDSSEYYLSIKKESEEVFETESADNWSKASEDERLSEVKFSSVKVTKKELFSIEIDKEEKNFGLNFSPKAICHQLVIESVTPGGASDQSGLRAGNEILMINGELSVNMSQNEVNEKMKNLDTLRLLVRTCYPDTQFDRQFWWIPTENEKQKISVELMTEDDKHRKRIEHLMAVTEEYLRNIVVPPPPVVSKLQPSFIRSPFSSPMRTVIERNSDLSAEDIINLLIIPPPANTLCLTDCKFSAPKFETRIKNLNGGNEPIASDDLIDNLLKKSEEVTAFCRQVIGQQTTNNDTENGDIDDYRQKSCVSKIQKVLNELLQTEIAYVQDIECLLGRYLEPLCSDVFPSSVELTSLMNSVDGMLKFQKEFLKDLTEAMIRNEDSELFFKNLSTVSTVFLKNSAQFKLYAVFSTCHSVAREILDRERTNSSKLQDFLEARNPKRQHASTLESYLIKPIQRVLKYPLLLREILILSESLDLVSSKVRRRLKAALVSMNGVARHINDFQTVHDEFGNDGLNEIIKHAMAKIKEEYNEIHMLSVIDLLCHCTTQWLNIDDDLRKARKANANEVLIFVFRSAIILLCRGTKTRDKKKGTATQQDSSSLISRSLSSSESSFLKVFLGSNLYVRGRCPGEKNTHCFLLCHCEKKYLLSCENHEVKKRLVKSIEHVILNAKKSNLENLENSVDFGKVEELNEGRMDSDNEGSASLSSSSVSLEIPLDSSLNSEDFVHLKTQGEYFYKPNFKVSPRSLHSTTSSYEASITDSGMATKFENTTQTNKSSTNFPNMECKRPRSANIKLECLKNIEYLKSTKLYSNNDLFFLSAPTSPVHSETSSKCKSPTLSAKANSNSSDRQSFNNVRYNMVYGVSPFESKI